MKDQELAKTETAVQPSQGSAGKAATEAMEDWRRVQGDKHV